MPKSNQPVKLAWLHFPAYKEGENVVNPPRDRAYNDYNGQIVGEISHYADRAVYTSYMPKTQGEQRVFINVEKAKAFVEERYKDEGDSKPKAPTLPATEG